MGLFSSIGKVFGKATDFLQKASPWGGIASTALGFLGSKSSARDQMDYQTMMSNTAHQREMADLRRAGLNPILSAKYGGASTPSGASYTLPSLAGESSSAASVPLKQATVKNVIEQNNNLQTNSALQREQARRIQLENDAFATLSPTMRAIVLSGGGASSAASAVSAVAKTAGRSSAVLKNMFPFFKRDGSQPFKLGK